MAFNQSPSRTSRHNRKDYTKDGSIKWFILLLVVVAVFIILRTLNSSHVAATKESSRNHVSDTSNETAFVVNTISGRTIHYRMVEKNIL